MFQKERYEQIYAILQERQSATVQYLQKRLYVSEATIRRDLAEMEKIGILQRVWGGAMLQTSVDKDPPTFVRAKTNNDKKSVIASIASKLIRESSAIFLDASTTVEHLVPYFANFKQLTLITNGIQLQQELSEQTGATVHLIGGQVFEKRLTTGHIAVSNVRQYHADMCFFSCSGISADGGITGIEAKSVEVCREMVRRSTKKICLCDTSKAGNTFLWYVASFDDVDYMIMDKAPEDEALVRALGGRLITDPKQLL